MKITSGDAELVLAPETGGAVTSWTIAGRPIFRPTNPHAIDSRGHACYPLVPYSNRVAHRRFTFAGHTYELPALLDGQAIHGAGWQCEWTPESYGMSLDYPAGRLWPFAFRAELHFELTPSSLAIVMRLTNRHGTPAPAAIGMHPFFPRNDETELEFAARSVWVGGPDKIPTDDLPVPPDWDFTAQRQVGPIKLDNCFAGWGGHYAITWPERRERVVVTATEPFRHLVVFTPRHRAFLAVEPVSNMNDGLNRMDHAIDHGMKILAPDETLEGRILMVVEPLTVERGA